MFKLKKFLVASAAVSAFALPFVVSAATLTASCAGTPTDTNITWVASTTGGVTPVALLWGNGNTSTSQTVAVTFGTYSMTLQATDASSTIATTTCSATVVAPIPPSPSTADQIAALVAQINALKAQLAQLLLQQENSNSSNATSSNATSTPAGCFGFNHDLEEGDQGDDVKDLQKTLASDPSVFPSGLTTGFFGRLTEEGVKKFQEKHGISSTGYFGPKSRKFFEEQCSTGDSDHDGVPNSIDEENNQNQSGSNRDGGSRDD